MHNTTIHWGIIAPGRIAHKFAKDLALAEGAKLHAVASRSLERAQDFAREYGAPHAFGSYEEILDCPGLDVVYIASPHSEHCAHTLMCLNKKIPVLCEKPFAMNLAQARQMVEAARSNDTFLMEALWTRFIPLFEKTMEMLEQGVIGKLQTIRADFGFKATFPMEHRVFNPALGGGALLDVGIYTIFVALRLMGKPDVIKAAAIFGASGADYSCGMLFHYPDNRLAVLDASLMIHTATEAFLYGEKGTITLHQRFIHPKEMTIDFYDGTKKQVSMDHTGFGYYHEIMEVMSCLRQGKKESDKMPLDFSLDLMETLDAVRREAGIIYPGFD